MKTVTSHSEHSVQPQVEAMNGRDRGFGTEGMMVAEVMMGGRVETNGVHGEVSMGKMGEPGGREDAM